LNRYAEEVAKNGYEGKVSMNLKERSIRLKRDIPAIYLALKKQETPLLAKICAWATIAYALSPIDLIPDFIPVLGYLDDLIMLPLMVVLTVKLIPSDIFEQCRLESEGVWQNGKPGRWFYALPIVSIWLLVLIVIVRAIRF
jgi:uncharacterized membrane protein YkvA (DUF1232 family)